MSEILRTPRKLLLHGICKIPAGKAGKAAAKQYANERKARKRALERLAAADNKAGIGLLVMLTSANRRLGRYIFKKLDKVFPYYVRALSDGADAMPAEEMSWLMEVCEERGYRILWLDLAGTEKIDKKAVLHLVAGELIRVLEAPAPEKAEAEAEKAEAEAETVDAEAETAVIEELAAPQEESEPETAVAEELAVPHEDPSLEEATEQIDVEIESAEPVENTDVEIKQEEQPEKAETVQEKPAVSVEIEFEETSAVESEDVIVEPKAEEKPTLEEKPASEEKPAPRRRSRKTPAKTEGEKAPAKPRRKRAPAAPLTVEATLAKRRKQMGLE